MGLEIGAKADPSTPIAGELTTYMLLPDEEEEDDVSDDEGMPLFARGERRPSETGIDGAEATAFKAAASAAAVSACSFSATRNASCSFGMIDFKNKRVIKLEVRFKKSTFESV